jgi:hypothetical protein
VLCRWGLGPYAAKKKQLIAEGKLDKYGRPNENTPAEYLRALPDLQQQATAAAAAGTPAAKPAAAAAESSGDEEVPDAAAAANGEASTEKKKKDKKEKKEKVCVQRHPVVGFAPVLGVCLNDLCHVETLQVVGGWQSQVADFEARCQ